MGGDLVPAQRRLHGPLVGRLVARRRRARRHVAQRQRRLRHAVVLGECQPALRREVVALDAGALAQRQPVAQGGQHEALLGGAAEQIGSAHRIGWDLIAACVHGTAEDIERHRIAARRRLLQPGACLDQVTWRPLAAQEEDAEIELGAGMSGRRSLQEKLVGPAIVARRSGQALGVDQSQPMGALGRSCIGGALDEAQALAVGAPVEQHGAEPGLGIGVARGERA